MGDTTRKNVEGIIVNKSATFIVIDDEKYRIAINYNVIEDVNEGVRKKKKI